MGETDACLAAGELFEQRKRVRNLDDLPDRKRFRRAKSYSKTADDCPVLITTFYSKHEDHRDVPVDYFMLLFTDDRFQTLADIEAGIRKSEVRATF